MGFFLPFRVKMERVWEVPFGEEMSGFSVFIFTGRFASDLSPWDKGRNRGITRMGTGAWGREGAVGCDDGDDI